MSKPDAALAAGDSLGMSPAHYLMESYLPKHQLVEREQTVARVRRAARAVSLEGIPVRYLRSIFIPADETCFHLFEGPSAEAIEEVSRHAALEYERIVEVFEWRRADEIETDEGLGRLDDERNPR
ncbi:MAG: nickel-binding protein [Gaiellaceae bacterium]